jgi:hypothetical protein
VEFLFLLFCFLFFAQICISWMVVWLLVFRSPVRVHGGRGLTRNRLLLSRPLFVTEYRTTMKSVQPEKPVSTKSAFRNWTPIVVSLLSWRYYICSFFSRGGYGLHKLMKFNENEKIAILCIGTHFESRGTLFLELGYSYSSGTYL